MILVRKANSRGKSNISWLSSAHTFSFADYYDPEFMGFRSLRVINEDKVKPGMGFGRHAHSNMEIISYVIDGALTHKDSMGNGSIIYPGEIQSMSAGTGIEHSEFNDSKNETLHFLQIWIIPEKSGLAPRYQQYTIPQSSNELILIGSAENKANLVHINQDVSLYTAYLMPEQIVKYTFGNERAGWLQLIKGELILNGLHLEAGDGAEITDQDIEIKSVNNSEFLLFDLL